MGVLSPGRSAVAKPHPLAVAASGHSSPTGLQVSGAVVWASEPLRLGARGAPHEPHRPVGRGLRDPSPERTPPAAESRAEALLHADLTHQADLVVEEVLFNDLAVFPTGNDAELEERQDYWII